MKNLCLFVCVSLLMTSMSFADDCSKAKPMFGENLSAGDFDSNVWSVNEAGELSAKSDSVIWTKQKYGDCKITFEYKLSKNANAGLLIKCSDKGNWIPNTIEIQLLDDFGTTPNYHCNASFYGYQAPTKVVTKAPGEWNKMEVVCKGSEIWVTLNGVQVNYMDMSQWKDAKKSPAGTDIEGKFQGKALADAATEGFVGLQGLHGRSVIYYRNLTIE